MLGSDIFESLVTYHTECNLPKYLDYLSKGGMPFKEGKENSISNGTCIVYVDDIDRLVELGIIILSSKPVHLDLEDPSSFYKYLCVNLGRDDAHVFENKTNLMYNIKGIDTNIPELRDKRINIPQDFAYSSGKRPETDYAILESLGISLEDFKKFWIEPETPGIGGRTNACICSYLEGVEAFVLRQTTYLNRGLGKVAHFKKGGLYEEFFFIIPNDLKSVYGVHRKYDGRLQICDEQKTEVDWRSPLLKNKGLGPLLYELDSTTPSSTLFNTV